MLAYSVETDHGKEKLITWEVKDFEFGFEGSLNVFHKKQSKNDFSYSTSKRTDMFQGSSSNISGILSFSKKDAWIKHNQIKRFCESVLPKGSSILIKDVLKYKNELEYIRDEIINKIGTDHNFRGITFCDVSAGGIQIQLHHQKIKNYVVGKQATVKYDFSNYKEVVPEVVKNWNEIDDHYIQDELNFISFGEKYGWD